MKQNFAILAVTALLLCSLTACGGDQNNGAANGNVNGAENGTTSGMTGKTDSGSNVGGELKTPPARPRGRPRPRRAVCRTSCATVSCWKTPASMTPTAFCSTAKTRITTPSGEEYGGAGAGSGCFSAVFPR